MAHSPSTGRHGRSAWRRAVAAVFAVAVAVPGGPAAAAAPQQVPTRGPAPAIAPTIAWGACDPHSPAGQVGGFDCGTISVPLDYDHPAGATVTLALVRHAATDPSRRLGTLFTNPGGPGGMGTTQIPGWIQFFPAEVLARFDVVSWDPRGIGESEGVQCFANRQQEDALLADAPEFPYTTRQERAYVRTWRAFGRKCRQALHDQPLLAHMGTADVARDLDVLRRAVGEPRLRYWGLSYGTFLGATYANLFPDKVGRLVLDGNLAPDNWTAGGDRSPAVGVSSRVGSDLGAAAVFDAFLVHCGEVGTDRCAFSGGSPAATTTKWQQLAARLKEGPLEVTIGGQTVTVTYDGLVSGLSDALDVVQPYVSDVPSLSIQGWAGAAAVLQPAWEARGTPPPSGSAPSPTPSTDPSTYAGPEQSLAVFCGDAPEPRSTRYYSDAAPGVLARSNELSLVGLWADLPCTVWPIRLQDTYTGPWDKPTANPILVVGNTEDPSTPYPNSLQMVQELADAHLLTLDGYGHTALLNGSSCINGYVTAYLVDGALPPPSTRCQQNLPPFAGTG